MKQPNELTGDHIEKISGDKTEIKGAYWIRHHRIRGYLYQVIADNDTWEHVSVTLHQIVGKKVQRVQRNPTWEEMCYIKSVFWTDNEVVIEMHPKGEDYVNIHDNCLHLWRPITKEALSELIKDFEQ